jgi:hypothetical protein
MVGLTRDGGHLTGRAGGSAGRMSVCRASAGSTLPEFREQAARLVIETGRPVAHVAAEIGVGEQLLGRCVRLAREAGGSGDTCPGARC